MGIIGWLVMGLIVGAVAKAIMPGKDPGGLLVTMGLGIAGAFVGGFVARLIGIGATRPFGIGSLAIATGGAILLLWIYRLVKSK